MCIQKHQSNNHSFHFLIYISCWHCGKHLRSIMFPNLLNNLRKVKAEVKSLSRVQLFVTPWTIALQAPPSMGFSRREYWSGLPFPSPGDLPNPGIEAQSLAPPVLQADSFPSEPPGEGIQPSKERNLFGRRKKKTEQKKVNTQKVFMSPFFIYLLSQFKCKTLKSPRPRHTRTFISCSRNSAFWR